MTHALTVVPGDLASGTAIDKVLPMLVAAGASLEVERHDMDPEGPSAALLASARKSGAVLMGFHTGHRAAGRPAPIVLLRKALGTYANLRPVQSVPGLARRFSDVDIAVVRETTEDIYAQLEHESIPGVFESFKVTTRGACERIARTAFEFARKQGRKKVTIVHKANIMKKSDGLFLSTARAVAADYPDIACDDCIVDALCMKLIIDPTQFDVLVAGNLFGDIVADLCAGLVGGRANCPSVNLSDELGVFTSAHGGLDGKPNLTSTAFAGVLLLRHLGEDQAADRLMKACEQALEAGRPSSAGGSLTESAWADSVVQRLG